MKNLKQEMSKEGNIAVIAGNLDVPRLVVSLQPLAERFSLTLFVVEGSKIPEGLNKFCDCKIYPRVENMPGYMRGIERELSHFDLLIGLEGTRLSTYQALQLSNKFGKPLVVLSHETQPLRDDNFRNVQAMQKDIYKSADLFLATCAKSRSFLAFQGVPEKRIVELPLKVDTDRFNSRSRAKGKFRHYVGMNEKDFVILFYDNLEANSGPETLLRGLHLLKQKNSNAVSPIKIILAGKGADEKNLKYLAYDLGIGDAVYFIHQEIDTFCEDVYLACDAMLCVPSLNYDKLPRLHFEILEAMACGVIPIVVPGSPQRDLVGELGLLVDELTPESLAYVLFQLMSDRINRERERGSEDEADRERGVPLVRVRGGEGTVAPLKKTKTSDWVERVSQLLTRVKARMNEGDEKLQLFLKDVKLCTPTERVGRIGEFLGTHELTDHQRGFLFQTKADTLQQLGELEEAIGVYESAIVCDEKNVDAYLGLGTIALSSFAQEEAATFFRKVVSLQPENARAALGLGLLFFRSGLHSDALYWLERSLLNGVATPSLALNTIARICKESRDVVWATGALEHVIDTIGEHELLTQTLQKLQS